MTIFSMCPQIAEEARELSVISFIRALIHSLGAHSHDLIASQRPTSEYHHLGVKVSTPGLVEAHSIYSKHPVLFCSFSLPTDGGSISHHHLYTGVYFLRTCQVPVLMFYMHKNILPLRTNFFSFLFRRIKTLELREAKWHAQGSYTGKEACAPRSAHSCPFGLSHLSEKTPRGIS